VRFPVISAESFWRRESADSVGTERSVVPFPTDCWNCVPVVRLTVLANHQH